MFLLDVESGLPVEARLEFPIQEQHLKSWESEWRPALGKALVRLYTEDDGIRRWPQNHHWNWQSKNDTFAGLLGKKSFCIVCNRSTQGMMLVDTTKCARRVEQHGRPIVYIDYLESAPWNRTELYPQGKYKGVGSILVSSAIQLSIKEGFKGRIGLHALPQAESFYSNFCGMTCLGVDDVHESLKYFEMTPEQAAKYMERGEQP